MPRKIACLCPTYKRPECLANVVECFLRQDYPKDLRHLFVLDDAGQFDFQQIDGCVTVICRKRRYDSLVKKFNTLATFVSSLWSPDVFSVWEDDDVYLPDYLSQVDKQVENGASYVTWEKVWGTYNQPFGQAMQEGAAGRFHASWSFTASLLDKVGGWPKTAELKYDQMLGGMLSDAAGIGHVPIEGACSYVYRWGNGLYHGSQFGDGTDWYDKVGKLHLNSGYIGQLMPKLDKETEMLLSWMLKPSTQETLDAPK